MNFLVHFVGEKIPETARPIALKLHMDTPGGPQTLFVQQVALWYFSTFQWFVVFFAVFVTAPKPPLTLCWNLLHMFLVEGLNKIVHQVMLLGILEL